MKQRLLIITAWANIAMFASCGIAIAQEGDPERPDCQLSNGTKGVCFRETPSPNATFGFSFINDEYDITVYLEQDLSYLTPGDFAVTLPNGDVVLHYQSESAAVCVVPFTLGASYCGHPATMNIMAHRDASATSWDGMGCPLSFHLHADRIERYPGGPAVSADIDFVTRKNSKDPSGCTIIKEEISLTPVP